VRSQRLKWRTFSNCLLQSSNNCLLQRSQLILKNSLKNSLLCVLTGMEDITSITSKNLGQTKDLAGTPMHLIIGQYQQNSLFTHECEKIHNTVGITPLIVIPGDNLEETLLAWQIVLQSCLRIINGGMLIMDEIG